MGLLSGDRPDLTPAQLAAAASAGVPVLSNLTAAFGVWAPTVAQQAALSDAVTWGGVLAAALVVSDTGIRAARNAKDAKVQSMALAHGGEPQQASVKHEVDLPFDEDLPDDDEEFGEEPESRMTADDPDRGAP